jgi:hypothetical protein
MNADLAELVVAYRPSKRAEKLYRQGTGGDFTCKHCGMFVSALPLLSGVNNRNHCPICLWSRHLDLYQPGDRLSACKGGMPPAALTLKQERKKYGSGQGELMLVHLCVECGRASANRIAADDDAQGLLAVFRRSLADESLATHLEQQGIHMLGREGMPLVQRRLFGGT